MKKLIFSGVLSLIVFTGTFAQKANSRWTEAQKQEFKQQLATYKEQLHLSPEQEPKVEAINIQFLEGLSQLKSADASKLSKYKKFRQISSDRDKKMKEVLTPDQYNIYNVHREQMKQQIMENRKR